MGRAQSLGRIALAHDRLLQEACHEVCPRLPRCLCCELKSIQLQPCCSAAASQRSRSMLSTPVGHDSHIRTQGVRHDSALPGNLRLHRAAANMGRCRVAARCKQVMPICRERPTMSKSSPVLCRLSLQERHAHNDGTAFACECLLEGSARWMPARPADPSFKGTC